ncbi:MAG TPA: AMP-binding protein, partial [Kineosporiaceae bacterium]|nr:AMP-binding protein [Kineosporiaceae bacterium]
MGIEDFQIGLARRAANFAPLTPLVFLDWSADVYPEHPAVVHGARRFTWRQTRERCRRLASALRARGIGRGDTVALLLSNTPEMIEAHFGIPMTGAVMVPINTRLDPGGIAFILEHAEARVLFVDRAFSALAAAALPGLRRRPVVVDVDDPEYHGPGARIGSQDYESMLASGDPGYSRDEPSDEWQAISLNYTSGTTGNPKGVVVHHRGAHLNAVGNILTWDMPRHSVYLWTLPMFHCNGWCFPWTTAANAGTSVCLRSVDAATIYRLVAEHRVTHYCGAPVVHNLLIDAPAELRATLDHELHAMIAAAPPPARTFEGAERLGIDLTHVYGLTEVYGPATVCARHAAWADLDLETRARRNGRQGVRYLLEDQMTVIDPATGAEVPADGETVGEIVFRGNVTMMGYFKNPAATEEAFAGGWFHSGDLAVREPDGYVKIKDRAKDVIISGGENISSVEVEDALYRHPAVAFAGVVAQPDEKWGETPCAYVELQPGAIATEAELIEHCRTLL